MEVDANAVILGIAVEEHAELQKRVRAVLNTGYHGARREGSLLDVAMEVLWVLVQDQAAELVHLYRLSAIGPYTLLLETCAYWKLRTGPDFRDIERVKAQLFWVRLIGLHDLHLGRPLNLFSTLNGLPQLLLGIVWVLARNLDCFWLSELLLAVFGHEMVLDVHKFALPVDPLESVTAVAVFVDPAVGRPVVGEEHETCVVTLRSTTQKVECRIIIEQEVLRVSRLGTNDIRTLDGVPAEEDRKVQPDYVIV